MSGQTSFTVTNQASLAAAIDAVDISGTASAANTTYTIDMTPGAAISLSSDLPAINLASGDTLIVNGNNATLAGNGNERGLFVYAGSVSLNNLSITGTAATGGSGGTGMEGGGGGAGLGGGLFVGTGALVATSNVSFDNNSAHGGTGGIGGGYGLGGGGGMGGSGGSGQGKSGGGGIGRGAVGAGVGSAGNGIVNGAPVYYTSGAYSGAGGGGGGGTHTGGGIGASGPNGGFGGGGGAYGNGGFGGGAGAFGKNGGFGGGGGGGVGAGAPGFGGGPGGAGSYISSGGGYYGYYYYSRPTQTPGPAAGGGGLGAGGNVFVQEGATLVLGGGGLLGGSVAGGAAGGSTPGIGSGRGLGSSVFIQGNGLLYLVPATGETLTIGGIITDQVGAKVGPTVQGSGTVAVGGAGMVVLLAAVNHYTGGTVIDGGTVQFAGAKSGGTGPIAFATTAPGVLGIDSAAPSNTIYNFAPGDDIIFANAPAAISYSQATHTASFAGGALHFDPTTAPAAISYNPADGLLTVPCFAGGTRIATARGSIAVEDLQVGDRVHLAEGGQAPIIWLGHRRVECRRHPRPQDVMPVRIAAHAFGLDRPRRDVVLSPDHAVFVEGVLIPVRYLLNGATVRQQDVAAITYWHVELERHGVLLAEGLPAESYLDTGNRTAFAGDGVTMAHPDFARDAWAAQGCAPLLLSGPVRNSVHRRLLVQALALGHRLTEAPALRLLADGAEVPLTASLAATLPQGTRQVRLLSRRFVPAETDAATDDWRQLGVALMLRRSGRRLPDEAFATGWHAPEGREGWRWTDGDAMLHLPPSDRPARLSLRLFAAGARYWLADELHRSRSAA